MKKVIMCALLSGVLCGCNAAKQTTDAQPPPQGSAPLAGDWTITFGMGGPDNESMNVTAVTTTASCPSNWDTVLTNYPVPAFCAIAVPPSLSTYGSGWITGYPTPTQLVVGSSSETVATGDQFYFSLIIGDELAMEGHGTWAPNTNPPDISGNAQCVSYLNEAACVAWQPSVNPQATFIAYPSNQN